MIENDQNHIVPERGFKGLIQNWRSDLLAAISVSLVAIPLGLGVAVASGAPAISGLISAIVGGIVVTLFRGSNLAINGPAAGLIAVILSAVYSLDDGTGQALNYVLAAGCIAGGLQVLLGLFNLGRVAEMVPSSVIQGIMVAIGIIIFSSQIHVAMGTQTTGQNTVEMLLDIFRNIREINPIIVLISTIGVLIMVFFPRIQSRFLHFFPASLWVLIATIPFAYFFNFFEAHDVSFLGKDYNLGPHLLVQIPDDLTDAFLFPNFSKIDTGAFWIAVLSITLIASIQTLTMAKAVDKLDPYKRKSDLNKDLIGVGIGTMVASAIGGLPIITVIVRSTVNITNNAITKWSNFYHGVFILIFLFLLAPVIQKVPLAALAAILVYIGFRLASPSTFKKIYNMGIEQLIFMVVTIIITLYFDLLWGIIGGTLFTLLVHILLARMPIHSFFKLAFNFEAAIEPKENNQLHLNIKGIANFLTLPKIVKIIESVPPGSDVHIDLSETRLVGTTFFEKILEFAHDHRKTGGQVKIMGLENHVSSSTNLFSLKIRLDNLQNRLTPRQEKLNEIAQKNGYSFEANVDLDSSYLRNFQFFDFRPIDQKSNCISGQNAALDVQWEIADLTFHEGAMFSSEIFHATLMSLRLPKRLPKFVLEKEGYLDKLFDRVLAITGYKDIDFENHPGFSKKFLLLGKNEQEIRAIFTPALIEFIENEPIYHIECNGDALLVFSKIKLSPIDQVEKTILFSNRLAAKMLG